MLLIHLIAIALNLIAVILLLIPQILMNPDKLTFTPHAVNPYLLDQLRLERGVAIISLVLITISTTLQLYIITLL